ncbi:MAG: nitrile hydratase accessory protein [Cyanobacteria bacterium P01_F01_bin.150]
MSQFDPSQSASSQNDDEPVFQAPWKARAFAIVNQLANDQEYSWSEWTEQFAEEIAEAEDDPSDTSSYYERWVRTCEKLLVTKGILNSQAIEQHVEELLIERETTADHKH